jgi:hypothetical protein
LLGGLVTMKKAVVLFVLPVASASFAQIAHPTVYIQVLTPPDLAARRLLKHSAGTFSVVFFAT